MSDFYYAITYLIDFLMEWLWIFLPLALIQWGLFIAALISLLRKDAPRSEKITWFLLIFFVNTIGPILYFLIASGKIGEEAERRKREEDERSRKY